MLNVFFLFTFKINTNAVPCAHAMNASCCDYNCQVKNNSVRHMELGEDSELR